MKKTSAYAAMLAASLGGMGAMLAGADSVRAIDPTELVQMTGGARGGSMAQTRGTEQTTSLSRTGERNSIIKAMFGGFGKYRPKRFPNGPGWTHAHVQRMACKRRNKIRNRKAHR